jgi:hypothetical protein
MGQPCGRTVDHGQKHRREAHGISAFAVASEASV